MKHNSNMINERVVFGLFSLLFILSAAQVAAILDMNDYQLPQLAQVKGLPQPGDTVLSTNNCVQVTPLMNNLSAQLSIWEAPTHYTYGYDMYYDIKNNCNNIVHIIDSKTLVNVSNNVLDSMHYARIERLTGNALTPLEIPIPNNTENIIGRYESFTCFACPLGSTAYRNSPVGTYINGGTPAVSAFSIPVGATVRTKMSTLIDVPDATSAWYRMTPFRIKWFYQSALSANSTLGAQVDSTEIKTYSFPNPNAVATDLVHFPMN